LNFDSIPKNIYFYLISFINEAVYGVEATLTFRNFCILLLKFKIPESYKYFRHFFADIIFRYSTNSLWDSHLNFFSQSPSKEDVRRHFEIPADINDWIKPSLLHDVFYNAILELFYDEFTDENVVNLYAACNMNYSVFSKAFIRRYFSIIDEAALTRAYNFHIFFSYINRAIICNELSVRFGKTIDGCYFSTRNSLNELSLYRLASFDSETIIEQLKLYSHSKSRIYDVQFIVTVINSDLITPKLRLQILAYFTNGDKYDVVELLIKETIHPINFINYFSCHVFTPLTACFDRAPEETVLEFVDSVNDPLICLMILDSKFSLEAKRTIQQKDLDLNRIYRFKIRLSKFDQFVGRTMHFKQILKELNDPKFNEAFRFNSNDLNHDYSTIDESLPVIIVDNDYTFTPNSQ
jgi:hypothetical protein